MATFPVVKEINIPYIIKEIACGYQNTLFLLESGYAFICGSQEKRQCGSKEKVNYYSEYFLLYPPRGTKFTHVVAGELFFYFLVEDIYEKKYGKLYALQNNPPEEKYYSLKKVEEVEDKSFISISAGHKKVAAITTEGELYVLTNNEQLFTKNETINDYICDNVDINENHMVVIARRKATGKKVVLISGDNKFEALCDPNKNDYDVIENPIENKFFLEKIAEEEPIKA